MGTRSTIKFFDDEEQTIPLCNIYQQFDGYLEGVGIELAEWLSKKKIINGIGSGQDTEEYANGIGCLAAQFIRDHKTRVGGLYITNQDDSQEYNYSVFPKGDSIIISVDDNNDFEGTPQEFIDYVNSLSNQ